MRALAQASMPTFVFDDRVEAERALAAELTTLVRGKPNAVLGLATGNSPTGLYRALVAACAAGEVSFTETTTFNLDEYLDLEAGHPHSFRQWMDEHLFAHVQPRATHLPERTFGRTDAARGAAGQEASARAGRAPSSSQRVVDDRAALDRAAESYEAAIHAAGGIDLQLLGIGRNGHIGFNEPGASRTSRTRVVELHDETRALAAATFGDLARVPKRAITMGIATILSARRIRVLSFGAEKAQIVRRTLCEEVSPACPSTFLRGHPDVKLFVDRAAVQWIDL